MTPVVGRVHELVRYPVKSMAGIPAESAVLGWHGFAGDRRFAFRKLGDESAFPWLSASRVGELILYRPLGFDEGSDEGSEDPRPTHVLTPDGRELALRGDELREEIAGRLGSPVELMNLRGGIFDDAPVSVIALATMAGIGHQAGLELDRRRFRANVVLETPEREPFREDAWVGGVLVFGDRDDGPAVSVTVRDLRCVMVNLDPDTAARDARVLKTVARLNQVNAGVYGTVVRTGTIRVGDPVRFVAVVR